MKKDRLKDVLSLREKFKAFNAVIEKLHTELRQGGESVERLHMFFKASEISWEQLGKDVESLFAEIRSRIDELDFSMRSDRKTANWPTIPYEQSVRRNMDKTGGSPFRRRKNKLLH